MNSITPYEVFVVAKMLHREQSGHPSNWKPLDIFVPIALDRMKELELQIAEHTGRKTKRTTLGKG